jgi:hypothetical protein
MIRMSYQGLPPAPASFTGKLLRAIFAVGVLAIGALVFAFSAAVILSIVLVAAAGLGIWLLQRKLRGLPSPFAVFKAWPPQPSVSPNADAPSPGSIWPNHERSNKSRSGVTIEGEVVERL